MGLLNREMCGADLECGHFDLQASSNPQERTVGFRVVANSRRIRQSEQCRKHLYELRSRLWSCPCRCSQDLPIVRVLVTLVPESAIGLHLNVAEDDLRRCCGVPYA